MPFVELHPPLIAEQPDQNSLAARSLDASRFADSQAKCGCDALSYVRFGSEADTRAESAIGPKRTFAAPLNPGRESSNVA
jgi:hypothetical protein